MKRASLFIIGILFCVALQAQSPATESREILFQVAATLIESDSLIAYIQLGKNAGIEKGQFGRCYTSYRKGITEDYTELGSCKIWWSDDTSALAVIDLYRTGRSQDSIRTGDFIALNISVPKRDYSSIIFDLATRKIDLVNNSREEMYNLVDLLRTDSRSREKDVLKTFVNDIKDTYEFVKDMEGFDNLKVPMKEGRYKGSSVFEIMRDVTEEDVRNFLLFVKAYPFKYMGITYKASETFATWVLNHAPTGFEEIKILIHEGPAGKAKLDKLLFTYSKDVKKDGMAGSICDVAISLSNQNKPAEASRIMEGVLYVVNAVKDTAGKAAYYLTQAQIAQDKEKYTEAITWCNEGLKVVGLTKDRDLEMQFLFKKAFCQYKNSEYKPALATISAAEKKLAEYKPTLDQDTYLKNLRKQYEYAGWVQYTSGDYVNALSSFRNGIRINDQINTYSSRFNNASNYWYIGKIYTKQSEYQKALPMFDTSYTMYKSTNSMKDAGFVINDIGWSFFKMKDYESSIKKHLEAYDILIKENDHNNAGYSKSMIGQNLWNLGKYTEAIDSHKESLTLRRKSGNDEGQAFSWEQLGELYLLSGEKTKALTAFDSATHYYVKVKDSASIAEINTKVGKTYEEDNDIDAAIKYYSTAYNFLKTSGNKDVYSDAIFKMGYVLFDKDPEQSKKYFKECLALSESIGSQSNQLYSLVNLGALHASDLKTQQDYYKKALQLSQKINTADLIAYCYSRMASGYEGQLFLEEALEHYRKAQDLYDSVDKKEYARQMINIANVMVVKGDFNESVAEYNRAVAAARSSNNLMELADALSGLAFVCNLQGKFAQAKKALDEASGIYQSTGNKIKLAGLYQSWGQYYQVVGNYDKSIRSYLSADSIYLAEKKPSYRQSVMTNMGVTYFHQADFKKSLYYHQEADKLQYPGLVDETYILCKANVAECLYYLKESSKAEAMLKQVYPIGKSKNANRITSSMAIILGKIEFDRNNLKQAEAYLNDAKVYAYKSNEKDKIVESLIQLAKVEIRQNKENEAIANLNEAVAIAKEFSLNTFGWEALYELGLIHYNNNKLSEAIAAFKSSVDILENTVSNIYGGEEAVKIFKSGDKKVDLYTKLVTALARSGNEQDAWAYANKSNLTALKDLQGGVPQNLNDPTKSNAIAQANTLLQQKANVEKSINELVVKGESSDSEKLKELRQKKEVLEKGYINYIDTLIGKYPELRAYFAENVHPEEFKKYKSKLPADAAAILYLVNDNQLLIFTVTNEKIGIKIREISEDFNKSIDEFILALSAPTKSETGALTLRSGRKGAGGSGISFIGISEKMYNTLIADVLDEVKNKKTLCIIPNGKLSNIPFQCLGKLNPDSSFNFLVNDFNIFYTNSLDIFLNKDAQSRDLASFAAYGNPDKSLPNSRTEVIEIGKILNLKTDEDVMLEDKATEQKAKEHLSAKKYIHFATHGVLNYSNFSESYLVLAKEKSTDDDGALKLHEIKELTMDECDMVTLSACETAVTNEAVKGWYISPANAFMKNGVKSVVASLWSVDDVATSKLMTEFYQNLRSMSKAQALRKAQETLSRDPKYVHPFYWGAFVLYGEWR